MPRPIAAGRTQPRLVMTLVVRDEEEVLEANLDYHLEQGVDFVIVTDHGSSDATPEILRRYEAMGVAFVIREEGVEHHQSRRVTHMARLAATRFAADWVINNDADEFWWPELGSLRDVFGAIPSAYGQLEVRRRNFLPAPPGPEPFYERMTLREAESRNVFGGPLETKVAHRATADIVVAPGNHSVSGPGLAPAPPLEVIEIMHFPMRSFAQFERKVVALGTGYESLPDRSSPMVGRDQLELLARHRAGRLREHFDAALHDPAQIDAGLRCGELVRDRRLARFFSDGDGRVPERERPDAPRARRLVGHAYETVAELEELRAHSRRLEDHNIALEDHNVALEARVRALDARVSELDAALHEAGTALEVIRSSKLMRYTDPARRLWYRLTNV